jgi:spore coat protein A
LLIQKSCGDKRLLTCALREFVSTGNSKSLKYAPSKLAISLVLLINLVFSDTFASKLIKQTPLDATKLPQFVEDLPDFSVLGRVNGDQPYQVRLEEFQQKILPDSFYKTLLPPFSAGTMVFGYGIDSADTHYPALPAKGHYPGYTVVVSRDQRSTVDYRNHLYPAPNAPGIFKNPQGPSLQNLLTVDMSLHWANPLSAPMTINGQGNPQPYRGPQPAVVHLHGAETPSAYDGGPEQWWTPGGEGELGQPALNGLQGLRGPTFVSNVYHYPNNQEPTALWFHDHTLGVTRLNVFAGLAAFYFIRGNGDDGIPGKDKLPAGRQEVELVIQDRQFDTKGQLLFPDGFPSGLDGPIMDSKTHAFWFPEFFGDVIVVNGKSWPKLNVKPQRYRFRILNGANTRFFNLQFCLVAFNRLKSPQSACADNEANLPFYVIGNDGGLLDAPVWVDRLLISPAERYDIIVDFAQFKGKKITLRNDAVTPYPSSFAKFTPKLQGNIMQFVVENLENKDASDASNTSDISYNPVTGGNLRGPGSSVAPGLSKIVRLPGTKGGLPLSTPIVDGKKIQAYRQLTLNPVFGSGGCHFPPKAMMDSMVELLVNNSSYKGVRQDHHKHQDNNQDQQGGKQQDNNQVMHQDMHGSEHTQRDDNNNSHQQMMPMTNTTPVSNAAHIAGSWLTELPQIGSTEIWDLVDLSNDDHPMHIHLVQFQVIERIPFDLSAYSAVYDAAFPKGACIPGYGPPRAYNTPNRSGAIGGNPDVTPYFLGPRAETDGLSGAPRPEEAGWKDTVIASAGHVTRVAVRFTPQDLPAVTKETVKETSVNSSKEAAIISAKEKAINSTNNASTNSPYETPLNYSGENYFSFDPTDSDLLHIGKGGYPGGPGYVWHCHFLDHEDNDMMRPWMPSKFPGNIYKK